MKKVFILMMAVAMMMTSYGNCLALAREQATIGGIGAGCTTGYVRSIYGRPDVNNYTSYRYGDGFQIFFDRNGIVQSVACSNSSLSTPDGVTTGMDENVLNTVYGQAGFVQQQGRKTLYVYPAEGVALSFTVAHGIIVSIDCGVEA